MNRPPNYNGRSDIAAAIWHGRFIMRMFMFIVVTTGLLAGVGPTTFAQPAATPAPARQVVELEQLAELGKSVAAIRYESDNVFIYTELSDALRETAKSMEGGQVEFVAKVMRVNSTEVVVEVEPAGKTRLVLMHSTAPVFGNLRTVKYRGPASTQRLHIFSAHVGLRIGSEIKLETAKTLRRRERLVIRGTIDALPVWIESVFAPDAVALISDWKVLEVNPQPSYPR
ncbi:MAG: hypothetical protein QF918_05880 [Pirellulaceae bacterium]|nr:hypothetical protein [Pirellulaceae bacterium]MDP6556680.1 hypothetical protein [Pirellulaceae bacterium]MDP6722049.1 hypothetical protein [Pirellulaceae bacterium]